MSRSDDLGQSEGLRPLRSMERSGEGRDDGAAPEDRWLAGAFAAMATETPCARRDAAGMPDTTSARGWAALEGPARRVAQRRRRGYLVRELLASALPRRAFTRLAAAALLLAFVGQRGDGPAPSSPSDQAPLIAAAHAVLSSDGTRRALLNNGAELQVDAGAVSIAQGEQARTQLVLAVGALRVKVPHLPGRGQLSVSTSDAEVIVHGTSFAVRKRSPAATEISVDEGLVEVRPRGGGRAPVFLRPGESLLVPSLARYTAEVARQATALLHSGSCADPQRSLDTYLELAPAGEDRSAVHYLKGFCAALRGDSDEALRWFERAAQGRDALRADNALARAAQLHAAREAGEGIAAWRRYLQRFPDGIHRESARRYLASAPPPRGP